MDTPLLDLPAAPDAADAPSAAALETVVVIGLGYVGLPLAVALARDLPTIGLDIDAGRIDELVRGHDRTGEIEADRLRASPLRCVASAEACPAADVYIVTVPTPVDERNRPDLRALIAASEMVGRMIDPTRRPVVIFESTVYPGVTEELCVPAIERAGGLSWRRDFCVGYSPERINPGDREHTVDKIVKVVAGDDPSVAVHDQYNRGLAHMLVEMPFGAFPMALGVLYDDPAPTFDSAVVEQNAAAAKGKAPDLQKLLSTGQTWMVDKQPHAL